MTIQGCEIRTNTASLNGGGISFGWGRLEVNDCEFDRNEAVYGGGLHAHYPTTPTPELSVHATSFIRNKAQEDGGAYFGQDVNAQFLAVTISGNRAGRAGGGVAALFGEEGPDLDNCTIVENVAFEGAAGVYAPGVYCTFRGTVVANNELFKQGPRDCATLVQVDGSHSFANADSDGSCGFVGSNDLSNIDPMLGPLGHHNSLGRTHAPLAGSPLIDHGDHIAFPWYTDSRGIRWPFDGDDDGEARFDIGAVEFVDCDGDGDDDGDEFDVECSPISRGSSAGGLCGTGAGASAMTVAPLLFIGRRRRRRG